MLAIRCWWAKVSRGVAFRAPARVGPSSICGQEIAPRSAKVSMVRFTLSWRFSVRSAISTGLGAGPDNLGSLARLDADSFQFLPTVDELAGELW